ncbi:hypothetical protein [Streptomyces sp. NPDC089915]|uniref:hypothetical protein n=1 Tax=Streptomyces sp. NPDC089915 TaxID=3155186 RepID=UPI0034471A24
MSCRPHAYPWAAAVSALLAGVLGLALALAPAGPLRATADQNPGPRAQAGYAAQAQAASAAQAQPGHAAQAQAGHATEAQAASTAQAQPGHAAQAQAAPAAAAQAGPGARAGLVEAAFAEAVPARGPVCVPDSGGAGSAPAVPPRAGQEHACAPVARTSPEGVRPHRAECVRLPVRGPDRPAPGPVELSVMRV